MSARPRAPRLGRRGRPVPLAGGRARRGRRRLRDRVVGDGRRGDRGRPARRCRGVAFWAPRCRTPPRGRPAAAERRCGGSGRRRDPRAGPVGLAARALGGRGLGGERRRDPLRLPLRARGRGGATALRRGARAGRRAARAVFAASPRAPAALEERRVGGGALRGARLGRLARGIRRCFAVRRLLSGGFRGRFAAGTCGRRLRGGRLRAASLRRLGRCRRSAGSRRRASTPPSAVATSASPPSACAASRHPPSPTRWPRRAGLRRRRPGGALRDSRLGRRLQRHRSGGGRRPWRTLRRRPRCARARSTTPLSADTPVPVPSGASSS